ncbi:hypothetical protein K3495_g5073 [Podosphaera aphanis]|nr:hypothetical protein K3495_g5073 [Podosphaera aphanis]
MSGTELGITESNGQQETLRPASQRADVEIDSHAAIRKIEIVLEIMMLRVNPGGVATNKLGKNILEALELLNTHRRLWTAAS